MKALKKISLQEKLHQWIVCEKGFTLIEAIVTVAIVGVVITPIAIIFQGALETSLFTRSQLKATQVAQQYVEAVEAMNYVDLKAFVDSGGVVDATSISAYGLPKDIEGLDVSVDLNYGTTHMVNGIAEPNADYNILFDNSNYKMPTLSFFERI